MSKLEELMAIISTQDRLAFIRFRQSYVSEKGNDRFKRLLKEAEKQLKDDNSSAGVEHEE